MTQSVRVACYALIFDEVDRLLLCRLSAGIPKAGSWTLPGGGNEFGEPIEAGVVREVLEETGLHVDVCGVADAHSELFTNPDGQIQAVRIVFWARVTGGELQNELEGSTDRCQFFSADEIEGLPCVALVRRVARFAWQCESED